MYRDVDRHMILEVTTHSCNDQLLLSCPMPISGFLEADISIDLIDDVVP